MTGICDQYGEEENRPPDNNSQVQTSDISNTVKILSSSDKVIFQLLKKLQDKVDALSLGHNSFGHNSLVNTSAGANSSNYTSKKNKSGPLINPNTGRAYKRYYWIHGYCGHWSCHCDNPKAGNNNDTNFKDCMGGSNKLYLPVPQK